MVNAFCAKQFHESLRKPCPKVRKVPPFSIQTLQRNTRVIPPEKHDFYQYKKPKPSLFRRAYKSMELPIGIEVIAGQNTLKWKVQIDTLDFHHYLPIFIEGLTEVDRPYKFLAEQGVHDMLTQGGHKVLPVVPQLIIPLKKALNTKHPTVLCTTLRVLQHLAMCSDTVGEALVPYYRQLLPIFNMYCLKNTNLSDGIDYAQKKGESVGDLIRDTLETLERYGGEDAFINIKYMVPTYESSMMN